MRSYSHHNLSPRMHKHTKLTPVLRKRIYLDWCTQRRSFRDIGEEYHVDKNIISTVIHRGRLHDFSVHDSTNHRYRTIERGLKRLNMREAEIAHRLASKKMRYERQEPGELIHGDTKRLPWFGGDRYKKKARRETLFIAIDDCTRWLVADILPDMTQWSAAIFLRTAVIPRMPFRIDCHYSDNGMEYRGTEKHALVSALTQAGIKQRFTKIRHPWTNGKAERVIRTLLTEWFRIQKFESKDERRQSLYRFVDWYNHERPHLGIGGQTPAAKLKSFLKSQPGDNAC